MTHHSVQDYSDLFEIQFKPPDKEGEGMHCGQFAEHVLSSKFGLSVSRVDYSGSIDSSAPTFLEYLDRWEVVPSGNQQAGDVVTIRIMGQTQHCGVMLNALKFLHILDGVGVCMGSIDDKQWCKRIEGFYRWR